MKIANFREYTSVLREIYTGEAMAETGNYYYALMSSGKDLAEKKAELKKKISRLNEKIRKQGVKIRETQDKKTAGLQMAKLKQAKQNLVSLLKELQNNDHFNVLSEEAKICVCSGFLLQKYLAAELIKNNPLNFPVNENGNLVVDTSSLRQSDIFHEAEHIKDFVAAYMAHYPEKVKTPGHFKTMLNGINTWQELLNYAEDFFEKLNDNEFLKDGPIKASRLGCEVVMEFPEEKLQLVRLHTEKALDYESERMKHCVGKGGYDKGVKSGTRHIYSLRDMSDDGEWLPHATIEYGEGKIKQIKGYENKDIPVQYIPVVRKAVFHILGSQDISKLYKENKLSDLEKWGYILDVNQEPHDLYNIRETIHLDHLNSNDQKLKILPLNLVHLNKLTINDNIDENTIKLLQQFQKADRIETNLHQLSNPMAARKLLLEYIGDTSIENIQKRFGDNLLKRIGFIYDSDKKLHDLTNLQKEIEISWIAQNSDSIGFMPDNMVSTETFVITSDIDDKLLSILNKFKKINNFKAEPQTSISDPIKARKIIANYVADFLQNIDNTLAEKLGFMYRWDPNAPNVLINIEKLQEYNTTHPQKLVDVINCPNEEKLKRIDTQYPLFLLMDHGKIIAKKVSIHKKITSEIIEKINRLAGIHYLNMDGTDCANMKSLDFSRINFLPTPDSQHKELELFMNDEMFLERTCIPYFVTDRAVTFNACTNLPPLTNIKFPHNVKHIMISPQEKEAHTLPDFRKYPELESLQLNNMDLSGNAAICLPKGLKYLAFYNCKFGQGINMDLSPLTQLKILRLNECDLSGADNIAVPQSLEQLFTENTKLKEGVKLPKIKNKTSKIQHFLNTVQIVDAR